MQLFVKLQHPWVLHFGKVLYFETSNSWWFLEVEVSRESLEKSEVAVDRRAPVAPLELLVLELLALASTSSGGSRGSCPLGHASGRATSVPPFSRECRDLWQTLLFTDDFSDSSRFVQTLLVTLNPHNYLLETSDSGHTKSKRSHQVCLRVVSRRALQLE